MLSRSRFVAPGSDNDDEETRRLVVICLELIVEVTRRSFLGSSGCRPSWGDGAGAGDSGSFTSIMVVKIPVEDFRLTGGGMN